MIAPLLLAFTHVFGGASSYINPKWNIQAYGLPSKIATSGPAQVMAIANGARATALGLLIYAFHFQKMYKAVNVVLLVTGLYLGLADAYIAWIAGVPRKIMFRLGVGATIASLGWFGVHSG